MKHKQTRRLFALLLVFALVIGLLPSVLADNEPGTAESAEETLLESQPEESPAIGAANAIHIGIRRSCR